MAEANAALRLAVSDTRSVSQVIADHIVGFDANALPASAVAAAKRLMLDTLAVAWAGADAPGSRPVYDLVAGEGGSAHSTVWGYGGKLPATAAAFLNSMTAAALDYDSVNTVHADMVALPAALALAERQQASGREFLTAFILGNDLCGRLGGSLTGQHKGWFTTSIYGVFGAAAAAARLLKLDAATTTHALGIALSQSAGTQQSNIEQALTKRLQGAFSARGGVFSALLAARGITAPREAFEGKFGLYQLYQEGDPAKVLDGLGKRFQHEQTALKKYPCCACSHASLDAALALIREHDLQADEVTAIEIVHSPMMHRLVGAPFDPKDNPQVTAQFSAQYAMASALLHRKLGIAEIQDAAVLDPRVKPIAQRVKIVVDETNKGSRVPATVTLTTARGTFTRTTTKFPWGTEAPPAEAALMAKTEDCLGFGALALNPARRKRLVERVQGVENVSDMAAFFVDIL
ncbi:MAG: MmgE/PrpD family protein [Burkholderiales bacterium]